MISFYTCPVPETPRLVFWMGCIREIPFNLTLQHFGPYRKKTTTYQHKSTHICRFCPPQTDTSCNKRIENNTKNLANFQHFTNLQVTFPPTKALLLGVFIGVHYYPICPYTISIKTHVFWHFRGITNPIFFRGIKRSPHFSMHHLGVRRWPISKVNWCINGVKKKPINMAL